MFITMARRKQVYKITIVAVVAVFSVGCSAPRLHNSFGSPDSRPITSGNMKEQHPSVQSTYVRYDVFGSAGPAARDLAGATANINYVDIFGKPQRVDNAALPWTLTMVKSTLPSVSVNIVAQTDADQIGCRISVNNVLKEEKIVVKTGVSAETNCTVTA